MPSEAVAPGRARLVVPLALLLAALVFALANADATPLPAGIGDAEFAHTGHLAPEDGDAALMISLIVLSILSAAGGAVVLATRFRHTWLAPTTEESV